MLAKFASLHDNLCVFIFLYGIHSISSCTDSIFIFFGNFSQELSGKSFVRMPQHNLVRIGIGDQGVYKMDSKTPKVGRGHMKVT